MAARRHARRVERLPLLPAPSAGRCWTSGTRRDADYPREQCVHELFEAQVRRTPDAVAVVHGERALTYAELNARANRLAHHLRALGVGPDERVAICLSSAAWRWWWRLLAVAQGGRRLRAARPAYPAERLAFMLADSAPARRCSRTGSLAGLSTGRGVPVIDLDGATPATAATEPETDPGRASSGSRRAPRLRDLHLRLHRPAQGRDGRAPQPGEPGGAGTAPRSA